MIRVLVLCLLLILVPPVAFAQPVSSGLNIQRAIINVATATTTTLVAAVAGQVINVYSWELFCNAANSITIIDSTPTTLVPIQAYVANQGVIRSMRSAPWFSTAAGKSLQMTTSAAQQCSGNVYYTQG